MENQKVFKEISPEKKLSNALFTFWKTSFAMRDPEEAKIKLLENLNQRIPLIIKDKSLSEKINSIINQEKDIKFQSHEEWRKNLANKISEELLKNYNLSDIEKMLLENHLSSGVLPINKMFTYNLEKENQVARLHLPVIFTDNPIELRVLIKDAIQKLQNMLKNDLNLKNVKKITMRSNLIFAHPDLVSKYGFKITQIEDEIEKSSADISTEDFLKINI